METVSLGMARNVTSDIQKEYDAFLASSADKLEKDNKNTTKDEEDLLEGSSMQILNKTDSNEENTKEKYQLDPVFDAYEGHLQANSSSTEQSVSLLPNECWID